MERTTERKIWYTTFVHTHKHADFSPHIEKKQQHFTNIMQKKVHFKCFSYRFKARIFTPKKENVKTKNLLFLKCLKFYMGGTVNSLFLFILWCSCCFNHAQRDMQLWLVGSVQQLNQGNRSLFLLFSSNAKASKM